MTGLTGPTGDGGHGRPPEGAAPDPVRDTAEVLAGLGRSWTWLLGSALATLIPGIVVLAWPEGTLHVVAVLLGLYLLLSGTFRFVAAFAPREPGERLTGLLTAVLFVLAGVLCLRDPLQTITVLSLIVGVIWLASGMTTAYGALVARDLPHRGLVLGAASVGIVAGIVVLAIPTQTATALARLLGLWLVLLGVVELAVALAWRAARRRAAAGHGSGTPAPFV
ncbi:HdeD family acid-resistance protein [Streptomyces sp. TRM49041]|uniref:HdeD family acid-resistance protein n=1 Tax=Streptomyces sp. TRM49041 TaxID=2603216 RepID=UPI0011EF9FA4|nr:DUF308 domain-containing protein [Streptomyces sp. TRM49041]